MPLTRRRFMAISAAALAASGPAHGAPIHQWRGVALGADASITLAHDDAPAIVDRALREIARLERVFSLHDAGSALALLNAAGRLDAPPFELLECLGIAGTVHAATGGRFDPTIQPLWALYAQALSQGALPAATEVSDRLRQVGWRRVGYAPGAVSLEPGMALSLNGIAQGYIADKVADLLRAEGLRDVLVNTGEFAAIGGDPRGGGWPVSLRAGAEVIPDALRLQDAALASSAPHAITFDEAGRVSHVLDPHSGQPAAARWRLITLRAPRAALADALSTACCLMDRGTIETTLARFSGVDLVRAIAV